MIICAAIKIYDPVVQQELVITGLRHGDCFKTIRELNEDWRRLNRAPFRVQGFINHKGEFLDRREALIHAMECGQITATHRYYQEDHNIDELYSEDLY